MTGRFARIRGLCRVTAIAVFALLAAVTASAQQASQPTPSSVLESFKLTLDQLEAALGRDGLGNDALIELRTRVSPLRDDLRTKADEFGPKLSEIENRLKQLGPPPEEGAPREDAAIGAERAELNRVFSEYDGALKQARLLMLRADQISDRIVERRRAIFARELFHRSDSAANPSFWMQVAEALPRELRGVSFLLQSWAGYAREQGGIAHLIGAALTLAAALAGLWSAAAWLRRRDLAMMNDGRFGKSVAALIVLARASALMPLSMLACLWVLDAFGLMPERIMELGSGLAVAVAVASLGRGVGLALFAPDERGRRLLAIEDESAKALHRHLTFGMRVFGAAIFLNILHKSIVAPVALTVATSALLALATIAVLVHALARVGDKRASLDGPSRVQWVRIAGWVVASALLVMVLSGYVGLAAFVAGRLLTVLTIFGALYLLLVFTDSAFTEALAGDTKNGRALASALGLRPRSVEILGMLVSGALRIALVLLAAFIAIGPWGIFAADFFGAIEGAVFGFKIGEITFSLSAILGAIAVLFAGLVLTRALQRWLQLRFLPRTGVEPSLQLSVSTIVGYVGVIAAVALAMSELGIDLQKIALVAGALSVGIGFGLQSIVSNFVSGLILLAERPIRVGDSIVVKGEEGYVRKISVRATEIETFERASVIVPNSELITGVVKNWTHANTTGRIIVKIGVSYDADAEKVREILAEAAADHPQVLQTPPPRVFLMAFGDSALEFELRCVVANVDYALSVKSDLHFAILQQFRAAGIEIPFPQREVRVRPESRPSATLLSINTARTSEG